MNKTFLTAAVAATMVTTASAGVNFTGKYVGKIKNNGTTTLMTQKIDLSMKATAGKSVVVMNMDIDTDSTGNIPSEISISEAYVKTKIGAVSLKIGDMKGLTGNGLSYKKSSSSPKAKVTTTYGGIKTTITAKSGASALTADMSAKLGGVKVKVQNILNDSRTTSLSATYNGVTGTLEHNQDTTGYTLATKVGGVDVKFVSVDATAGKITQNDGIFGNISGAADVKGFVIAAPTALGKVTSKFYDVDGVKTTKATLKVGQMSYTIAKTDGNDVSAEAKISFKF
jgi:hypothetical protein